MSTRWSPGPPRQSSWQRGAEGSGLLAFERATIIDRVINGMERQAARGGWNGGYVPFGYRFISRRVAGGGCDTP